MKTMIAYTHLMEFLPGRTTQYSGMLLFADNFVPVVSTLVLMYVTKYPQVFVYVPLGINILAIVVFMVIYIPESTKFLMEKGQ